MVLFFALSLWSFFRSGSLGGERNIFPLFSRRSRGEERIRGGLDEFVSYLFLLGDENNEDDKGTAWAVPSPSADFCAAVICVPAAIRGAPCPGGRTTPAPICCWSTWQWAQRRLCRGEGEGQRVASRSPPGEPRLSP